MRPTHESPETGARLAAAFLALVGVGALAAPWLTMHAPTAQLDPVALAWQPPSAAHWLGTDSYSRDVWSRLLFGARATMGIAVLAVTVSLTLGTLAGAGAALAPRWLDALLMRATDALLAIPRLLLLLLVVAGAGTLEMAPLAILLGGTGWMMTARVVRQESGRLLATPHLEGARALGVPWARLLAHHLLPSLLPTLAVAATAAFAAAVPLESGLSYLGLGVRTPLPSWGNLLADAESQPLAHWWLIVFPTVMIAGTVLAANTLASALERRWRR